MGWFNHQLLAGFCEEKSLKEPTNLLWDKWDNLAKKLDIFSDGPVKSANKNVFPVGFLGEMMLLMGWLNHGKRPEALEVLAHLGVSWHLPTGLGLYVGPCGLHRKGGAF